MGDVDFGVVFGQRPEEIVKYFKAKGYVLSGSWTDVWEAAHARAFTVANVMKMDILQDIHAAVSDVIVEGKNRELVQKDLQIVLEQKGWWGKGLVTDADGVVEGKRLNARRVQTIFDTNVSQAYNAAQWRKQDEIKDLKPWRVYNHHPHKHPRKHHAAMNGLAFRQDYPIWEYIMPVNGWGCHCDTSVYSDRDIARKGWGERMRDSKGALETHEITLRNGDKAKVTTYTDPVTGAKMTPDAGFNYNPGKAHYQPDLNKYEPRVARQYVKGALTGPEFQLAYSRAEKLVRDNPNLPLDTVRKMAGKTEFPVAVLPKAQMQALGVSTQEVLLSEDTLVKQVVRREGQDIGLKDYWRVQDVLEQAAVVVKQGDHHLMFFQKEGAWYSAVVKATAALDRVYLQSFRFSNEKQVDKAVKNNEVVFDRR